MRSLRALYIRRKLGSRMGKRYRSSSLMPLILIFIVSMILIFALTFIVSMSSSIDRMIQLIGSGTLYSAFEPDDSLLPQGSYLYRVKRGEGILSSENGKEIAVLKGVEDSYFEGERGERIKAEGTHLGEKEILISKSLADELSLSPGDRMTLLVYEKDKERTVPSLVTVKGIFDSGYKELDRYMAFVPLDMLYGECGYEILLKDSGDTDRVQKALRESGVNAVSYREMYYDLYSNVKGSTEILYFIFGAVALLSAFFSIDIAHIYVSRDSSDIASLRTMGLGKRDLRGIYTSLTVISVGAFATLGALFGVLLSFLSPALVSLVSRVSPSLLDYYISSFEVRVPIFRIALVLILMALVSYISALISLGRLLSKDQWLLVNREESW